MTSNELPDLWVDEDHAYSVVTTFGAVERPERSGLSHGEAMRLAADLRRDGVVATVMHVIGDKR